MWAILSLYVKAGISAGTGEKLITESRKTITTAINVRQYIFMKTIQSVNNI